MSLPVTIRVNVCFFQASREPAKGGRFLLKPNATDESSLQQLLLQPPLCSQCSHTAKVHLFDILVESVNYQLPVHPCRIKYHILVKYKSMHGFL